MSTAPDSPDDVNDQQDAPANSSAEPGEAPAARASGTGAKRPAAKKASPRSGGATKAGTTASSRARKTATAPASDGDGAEVKPAPRKAPAGKRTPKAEAARPAAKSAPAKRTSSTAARAKTEAAARASVGENAPDDDNTNTVPRRPARKTTPAASKARASSTTRTTTRPPAKKTSSRSAAAASPAGEPVGAGGPEPADSVASSEDAVITGVGSDRGTTDVTNEAAETADGAARTETAESASDERSPDGDPTASASPGSAPMSSSEEPAPDAGSGGASEDDVATGEAAADAAPGTGAGSLADALTEPAVVHGDADHSELHTDVPDAAEEDDAELNDLLGLDSDADDGAPEDDADQPRPADTTERTVPDGSVAAGHAEAHLLAPLVGASPRHRPVAVTESAEPVDPANAVLVARGLVKDFGGTHAVDEIDLTVPTGSFYGIVGPNGAGKTTTLSMISGLLRPDRGTITVAGIDARQRSRAAKKLIGVLPDRFRTFDRLTGRQLLHYYGLLRGLKPGVVDKRTADLARAFDLTDALGRAVSDYSAGMTKKVMLAGAMIHSPRLLVLDEPFEAVDPVSAAVILEILSQYVAGGGTVILSSHTMELVERVCSRVAVVVSGQVLAEGTVEEVRGDLTLEQRFVELSGGLTEVEGLEWLHTFSD